MPGGKYHAKIKTMSNEQERKHKVWSVISYLYLPIVAAQKI